MAPPWLCKPRTWFCRACHTLHRIARTNSVSSRSIVREDLTARILCKGEGRCGAIITLLKAALGAHRWQDRAAAPARWEGGVETAGAGGAQRPAAEACDRFPRSPPHPRALAPPRPPSGSTQPRAADSAARGRALAAGSSQRRGLARHVRGERRERAGLSRRPHTRDARWVTSGSSGVGAPETSGSGSSGVSKCLGHLCLSPPGRLGRGSLLMEVLTPWVLMCPWRSRLEFGRLEGRRRSDWASRALPGAGHRWWVRRTGRAGVWERAEGTTPVRYWSTPAGVTWPWK